MPTTRRRRANPPEQQEQLNAVSQTNEQKASAVNPEAALPEGAGEAPKGMEATKSAESAKTNDAIKNADVVKSEEEGDQSATSRTAASAMRREEKGDLPVPSASPTTPVSAPTYQSAPMAPATPPVTPVLNNERNDRAEQNERTESHTNVESHHMHAPRPERLARERQERPERQDYTPTIEGGRRTSRGELFRRPPQPPPAAAQPQPQPLPSAPLQAPSHEISLPLGNLLHLAYNPGYTGSEEARSALLQQLENESKAGGRARCWSCGSLAIVYDRWSTRSKTFGEVGVAFCEICGVWSVM